MGMGEPLLNFTKVEKAVGILSSSIGLGISQRHVTVSTAGLVDKMAYLLKSPWKVKLAVSLNFPDEEMRREMMPVANNNPLKDILKIAREYSIKKSMVTFEIVIIDKLNDRLQDARLLVKLLRNIPSKINLIPFNEHPSLPYKSPDEAKVQMIKKFLMDSPHAVTLRKSRGSEILAGCGQLAAEVRK